MLNSLYAEPWLTAPVWSVEPRIEVTSRPTTLAVTLAEMREFIGLPDEDDSRDAELTGFLHAAQVAIEQWCESALFTTTFSAAARHLGAQIWLKKRPFRAVTEFQYVDTSGQVQTMDASLYEVAGWMQGIGVIFQGSNVEWPQTADRHDAVRISFQAGYGTTAADIPVPIKQAILMTAANLDGERGDCDSGSDVKFAAQAGMAPQVIPPAARAMLTPYRYMEVHVA